MLALALGGLGEVFALAFPIDHKVGCRAVALAGHFGLALRQQLDVASQHNLYGFLHPAIALWQGRLGFLSHLSHRLTPCLADIAMVGEGVAFPVGWVRTRRSALRPVSSSS